MFGPNKGKTAEHGFSLVELMIVVAIIGVLAALAVPKFQSFQAKAKQSEAKSNLSHIYTLEQSYYGDQDVYITDPATLGFATQGHSRYGYAITIGAGGATFVGTATATSNQVIASDCAFKDRWTINEKKELILVDDCVSGKQGINRKG